MNDSASVGAAIQEPSLRLSPFTAALINRCQFERKPLGVWLPLSVANQSWPKRGPEGSCVIDNSAQLIRPLDNERFCFLDYLAVSRMPTLGLANSEDDTLKASRVPET